ncbi:helix-turn-helix domain-containing protein [Chitinophaga flava]|uniref:HTH araC/xylS-type domain-containing protein n=1 Tax=Chitinophaga flava TaxID=2259036 RepID=A0A365XTZ4_9BACT|nr:AraC family transcriptional regulator [Chitinophaga flava]RBL89803.1 hypothetical protein DF182_25290 [Chitinophaga flava]
MHYKTYRPEGVLADFIGQFYWGSREATDTSYHATAKTGTILTFTFNQQSDTSRQLICASIEGQTERFTTYTANGFDTFLSVTLHPGAVSSILQCPPAMLQDNFVHLDDLLGKKGKLLEEKIASASSNESRILLLQDFIRSQLALDGKKDQLIIKAVQQIRKQRGNVNIDALASDCALSKKQFERRFKQQTGFNPKLYSRIVRFEFTLTERKYYTSLTGLAHAAGYYDQAHFIHEFKKFTGFTPSSYLSFDEG